MNELQDRRTSRLVLRRLTANDAAAVLAIDTDPRTNAHRPGGPPSRTESERAFQGFLRCWQQHGVGYWAVEFGGHVVGIAGVRPLRSRSRECWNLYYRLAPEAWGQGIAAEAAREAVAAAGSCQPDWPVLARTRPANYAAIRVAQAAGLERRSDPDLDGFVVLAHGW